MNVAKQTKTGPAVQLHKIKSEQPQAYLAIHIFAED
uniref:Uncharacterized protein n=1 Tax=Anguilla anguilla TaxID=7936 RepID=A0A0E9PN65_ANGAN